MIRSNDHISWRIPMYRWLTPEGVDLLVIVLALLLLTLVAVVAV
jgi:hypothetical protein